MDDFTPKYISIQNYIINKIKQGELNPGDRIPSENELSEIFKVSRVTSNKAVSELNMKGIVERIRGKGTFVKQSNGQIQDMPHILSESFKISSEMSDLKAHKVEKIELIKAKEEILKKLNLNYGDKVYLIIRIMKNLEDQALAIDYTYIPEYLFNHNVPDERLFSSHYIHEYLKLYLNLNPKYLHTHIDTKLPNKYEMEIFSVPKHKPLITWDTNIIDDSGRIIAYTTTTGKAEVFKPFINFEIK